MADPEIVPGWLNILSKTFDFMIKAIYQRRTALFLSSFACLGILLSVSTSTSQTLTEPRRDQLLNGFRVLIWPQPGNQNVLLKLRIHSGAAFDLAGKGGEMAILGDALFPDQATREFFTEATGGRLQVDTNYDSITITALGRAGDFNRIVEILRAALATTQLTPEYVAKARDVRLKTISGRTESISDRADRTIAARLFGDFPYGRPYAGTAESIARVDRADLLLARERFLNPNNATLVIIGGVNERMAVRALHQLLGSWRQSEQTVPATFRQPNPPNGKVLVVNSPAAGAVEVRVATRGLARSDRDYPTAELLAAIARERWRKQVPELSNNSFVRHEAHYLPGTFVMGAAVDISSASRAITTAQSVLQSLVNTPASAAEFEMVKSGASAQASRLVLTPEALADAWLDIDTYNLPPVSEQRTMWTSVSAADLQRVAARLFRDGSVASVAAGNSEQLKAELSSTLKIEVAGEALEPQPKAADPKPSPQPSSKTRFRLPTKSIIPVNGNPSSTPKSSGSAPKPD